MIVPGSIADVIHARGGRITDEGEILGILPRSTHLRIGPPESDLRFWNEAWVGTNLWCWKSSKHWKDSILPLRPWHGVVSSRVGRHPERQMDWMELLELSMRDALREGATLFIPCGSPASDWVAHAAQTFHVPRIDVHLPDPKQSMETWLKQLASQCEQGSPLSLWISPSIHDRDENTADRDRFAVGLLDRISVLHLRSGGSMETLVRRRIAESAQRASQIRIAIHLDQVDHVARDLVHAGAVGWYLCRSPASERVRTSDCEPIGRQLRQSMTLEELLAQRRQSIEEQSWPYLVHCTRALDGPWPEESQCAWRDRLLLDHHGQIAHPRETLLHILQQQMLYGGQRTTRGNAAVVCFSQSPLPELLRQRTYRAHLGRWDYEPYGIGLSLNVVQKLGGKPVIYGDEETLKHLVPEQRPWFQHRGERYDWTREREYRVVGNVSLREIALTDAFVFVACAEDIQWLNERIQITWPIVSVLESTASKAPTRVPRACAKKEVIPTSLPAPRRSGF
jgi:hypothetical protein